MGDLDTCLITEFAKRPGFYDRGSPYFKDKMYTENAWKEIALELGYEDGHIRPRKSYKSMMRKAYEEQEQREIKMKNGIPVRRRGRPRKTTVVTYAEEGEEETPVTNGSSGGNGGGMNGNSIKHEVMSGSDDDLNTTTDETFLNPANLLATTESSSKLDTTETLRNKKQPSTTTATTTTTNDNSNTCNQNHQRTPMRSKRKNDESYNDDETEKMHRKTDKFTAFGQFITASLSDLPEQKALDLIEKFTVQLVSSMRVNLE